MSILVGTHARIGVKPGAPFQYIREVVATANANFDVRSTVREKLCASQLSCQKGMSPRSTVQCLSCPRLVNFIPKDDSVHVRCLWTDLDHVSELMTLASELVTITTAMTILEAEHVAKAHDIRHLLVVEEGRLIGLVHREDLREEEFGLNTISDRVNLCPWTIGPETTLVQAAQLMVERNLGLIPVIANREVLGVVSRGDLERAGAIDSILGARELG
jgi:CBS domain-containing protein